MIKAIDTFYNGYRFRSRLEARWAVFFDSLGVRYEYEKEGYNFGNGMMYLPDFWLPDLKVWYEVKGDPNDPSIEKCEKCLDLLAQEDGVRGIMAIGSMPLSFEAQGPDDPNFRTIAFLPGSDEHYHWCICENCGKVGIEFDARSARIKCLCDKKGKDKNYTGNHPRILQAYAEARVARFQPLQKIG